MGAERMKSIIQRDMESCFICGTKQDLHLHHVIFGTANRKNSDKYGLTVWLCVHHHTGAKRSVHQDYAMNLEVKRYAQKYFEENIGTREEFIKIFGKNYIWEE
jgi:hypothetical protein